MEINITNLSNTPLPELNRCFNEAFSDYFVKFNATESYLKNRWQIGRVDYGLSFGCFVDGVLRGFIVHGIDTRDGQLTAHNCATGIEPPFRGQGLLAEMYETAIPTLRSKGVTFSTLEVISKNKKAIRAYEKAGFKIRPVLLHCFNGQATLNVGQPDHVVVKKTNVPDFPFYSTCRDFEPTWEMTDTAMRVFPDKFEYWEIWVEGEKAGYLIHSPSTGLVQQFAIHKNHRHKGLGKILFKNLLDEHKNFRVNNVPETSVSTVNFLKKMGLENPIDQFEMERPL